MTIDIEFLLAWHPLLFFRWECRVERFNSGSILTAVGGGRWNVHPLSAVERIRYKLANEKRRWEVAVNHEADVLLFAAHKSTADIVARIAEIDVYIVAHLACVLPQRNARSTSCRASAFDIREQRKAARRKEFPFAHRSRPQAKPLCT